MIKRLGLYFTAMIMSSGICQGHSPSQSTEQERSLSGAAQETMARLTALSHLTEGQWHFHDANIEHEESPDLNDSDWPIAKVNADCSTSALWFRQWVEVPKTLHGYDLTGVRIWFQFSMGSHGPMSQIIYFNGRRVAMGEEVEPIVLFDRAQPGEKVLIAVKFPATLREKHFSGASLKIDFGGNRPSPEDFREEVLSATALVPSLSNNIPADYAILEKAIGQVDTKALDASDQEQFDASLRKAQSTLNALKPMMNQARFHLTGDSHIDAAWLWPWTETVDVVKHTFSTALQLMNEYPTYTFTQSSAAYNDWMATDYPEVNAEIAKRIKEGRWEVVGGMWVEPDLNMPDGESTARSLLIGKRWYKQHYGVDVRIGWNLDSFGYNWQLPQIYKKSGVDYFVTQKMSWNDTNQLPFKLFWWESPDGSKVLSYFPRGLNTNLSPVRLSGNLANARKDAPGMTEMMDLYGVGDHGGGPTRSILDEGLHWMQPDKVVPTMGFGTAKTYFAAVENKIASQSPLWNYRTVAEGYHAPAPVAGEIAIPTWKDELYLEYHRGVFTTQANQKRNLREASEWALDAEKYASLAWLDGDAYPSDELTEAWKKITFNDFHDVAAGSAIGAVYKDAQKDYNDVRWATNEISASALKTITAQVDTRVAEGVPVLVFNPLAWVRSGSFTVNVQLASPASTVSVLDTHGRVLPSEILSRDAKTNTFRLLIEAKDVPAMGYEVLRVIPERRAFASDLRVDGTTLENAALRVVVDPKSGCISSLYDIKANFETLAAGSCGNELETFKDTPKAYDAWNIDPGTLDHVEARLTQAESVTVLEKGPMRGVIRVTRTWQNSKFVQDIVLYSGSDEVEIVNDIDWHETHVLLKAGFKLAASSPFATYEIPYGTIQRPTTRNNSWDKAQFEVPALRWADLGDKKQGFSLINESKFGYDGVDDLLRLTLLRSPVLPDPEADRGHHHFRYALYPHAGGWQQAMTIRHGYEFNYELLPMEVEAHSGSLAPEHSFVGVSSDNVVLTAMKKAEDDHSLIFHLYEWAGREGNVQLHVPAGATGATETNLMEEPEGAPLAIGSEGIRVPVRPYEILSVRVTYPEGREESPPSNARVHK